MSLPGILTRTILGLAPAPAPATHAFVPPALLIAAPASAVPATPAPPVTATADGTVDRVQQFYAHIKQVTAVFHQSVTYATFGNTQDSDGTIRMAKPGKMRWDYADKKKAGGVRRIIVSNGKVVYIVEHDKQQVTKKRVQQDLMPVAVSFLYGKGDLKGAFTPEFDKTGTYGAKDDLVLRLTPKQASIFDISLPAGGMAGSTCGGAWWAIRMRRRQTSRRRRARRCSPASSARMSSSSRSCGSCAIACAAICSLAASSSSISAASRSTVCGSITPARPSSRCWASVGYTRRRSSTQPPA